MTSERLLKPWKPHPQTTYIFRNASLVDPVEGLVLSNRTIKISGGLIKSVTKAETEYVELHADDEIRINLEGRYVCPGLIDNHVHISAVPGEKNLGDIFAVRVPADASSRVHKC
jgi:adenine deaminase